jgi:hypothetical protein
MKCLELLRLMAEKWARSWVIPQEVIEDRGKLVQSGEASTKGKTERPLIVAL